MDNQLFYDNYNKTSDMIEKEKLKNYILNSSLINDKLEINYRNYEKMLNYNRSNKKANQTSSSTGSHATQPKHTIEEILGLKASEPECGSSTKRNKEATMFSLDNNNSSFESYVSGAGAGRCVSPDSRYKSGW